jgi:hypothetical protein
MSEKQRNTTTNESDSDAPETAGSETDAVDTTESGAGTVTDTPEEPEETATEAAERSAAEESGAKESEVEAAEDEDEAGVEDTGVRAEAAPEAEERVETEPEPAAEPVADRTEAGEAPVTDPKDTATPQGPGAVKATLSSRKAHLTVSRVEPWSVMKFSFVVSLVCFIILFVAVTVIYTTLSMLGVFDELTNMINALLEGDGGGDDELGLNPGSWFSPGRVLGYTGVVGALNIVLITALSTVGAMLYNLVADLVGGVDVTLSEAE